MTQAKGDKITEKEIIIMGRRGGKETFSLQHRYKIPLWKLIRRVLKNDTNNNRRRTIDSVAIAKGFSRTEK
jgi:hypothetical protein